MTSPTPHYLRFARALVLSGVLGTASAGCCPMIPDSLACAHCTCSWDSPSGSRPLACTTIHRDPQCCPRRVLAPPVVGPLSPPDLAVG